MIRLANSQMIVVLNPAKGGEILHIGRPGGLNSLATYDWESPAASSTLHSYYDSQLDWLSTYRGGWQETVPNAGLHSEGDGVPLPFHGEASVLAWTVDVQEEARCVLHTSLRLPLTVTREMSLDPHNAVLRVRGLVRNDSDRAVDFVWGHHPVFPALPGTQIHVPRTRYQLDPGQVGDLVSTSGEWPHAKDVSGAAVDLERAPEHQTHRLMYLHGHTEGWAVIRQPEPQPSVAMVWDLATWPAMWLWENLGDAGYPWFGRMNIVAVEPQRAWPFDGLAGAVSRNQHLTAPPRGEIASWLTYSLPGHLPARIGRVVESGEVIDE